MSRGAILGLVLALSVLAATTSRTAAPPQQGAASTPKLVVMLVIDQMRYEYIQRYGLTWRGGLKRLVSEGAVFEQAFYPYLNTVTCAGHATIGTGALPYQHGIIMNEWYQREAGRRMSCSDDPAVASLPYAPPPEKIGHSAHRLRVPTLGDRLRAASPQSRVVTLSMKPRSTVMLAGRGGTAVTWFGDTNTWTTSTAYAKSLVPEVAAHLKSFPVAQDRRHVWDRIRPANDYQGADDSPHERPRTGWTTTFPHPLAGAPGTPPEQFYDLWERSPFSDSYLGRMAEAMVESYRLGQRDDVDYLAVSFSALDYIGHDFGPDSHEVQDALYRLDATLGDFFTRLDKSVGRDRYVVGLSSDHGVSRIPEAVRAEGGVAGRVLNAEVQKVAEAAMREAYGEGPHVAHVEYTNVYLTPAARARADSDPTYLVPLVTALTNLPGIDKVFLGRDLLTARTSTDPLERAAALGHHPEESGELVVTLQQDWIGTNTSAATHGSARKYDQHVPVVFLGARFKPGRYTTTASPADLAPTLGSLVGVPMPDVAGRILKEALR